MTDSEFARLLESIVTPDAFTAAKHLCEKNSFEVVNQQRISTDYSYSHHRYDVILLINGVPVVQIVVHRQQPLGHLVFRQQQQPPLQFQCR